MTFAAVGSPFAQTSASWSLTPHTVGDLILVEVISETAADYATALSSSNVTWSVLVPHVTLGSVACTVFIGKVTAASAATVTVSLAAGSPTLRIVGMEFSTTAGFAAVTLDTSGTVSSITANYPLLTPRGSGELYFGYAFDSATATAGSTSGYVYYVDANGNGLAYNAACTSSAQQPVWGTADGLDGVAVLLYEAAPAAFTQPGQAARGRRSARKGSTAGSPGAPRVYVPPVMPSPFAQPGTAVHGKPAARRDTPQGSPGAPYVYVPVFASVFTQPGHPVPAHPAARKGSNAGSPGAPWSAHRPPAPFAVPNRAAAGRRAARKGTASGSPAPLYSPLVQETSGSTTGTTLTLTFPNPTMPPNGVVIALCGYTGGSVSNITLGGTGSVFTRSAAAGGSTNTEIWADAAIGQSSTTIVITTTVGGIIAWAYEVSRWVSLDTTAGNSGSGTSWSSGATGTTIPYPHFIVGAGAALTSGAVTPTAGGWSNESAVTGVASGSGHVSGVSGWRPSPYSAGTYTYSGTTASASWGAVTAAYAAIPPPVSYNTIWSGYGFLEHASYTGVSATFTLPATMPAVPNGTALVSVWVGLGNVNQIGVYLGYDAARTGGVYAAPWSWWIPGTGEIWAQGTYPMGSGDSLTVSMDLTSDYWYMTMANNTRGWSYTEAMSVLATNFNSWNTSSTSPYPATTPDWIYPVSGAEVIIEKEASQAADYGSITFTSVTTTPPIVNVPEPIFSVDASINQYPGPFNLQAGSFTNFWNAPS